MNKLQGLSFDFAKNSKTLKKNLLSALVSVFSSAMIGIGSYVAGQVKDVNMSINQLNKNVAVLITQSKADTKRVDSIERRVTLLEKQELYAALRRIRKEADE